MGMVSDKYKEAAACQLIEVGYEAYKAYFLVDQKDQEITEQVKEWLDNEG